MNTGASQATPRRSFGSGHTARAYPDHFLRWRHANNARTALAQSAAPGDIHLRVLPGEGMFLPVLGPGDRFAACLFAQSEGREILHEIVAVKSVVGDFLEVERAQEATGAREWPVGTPVSLRVTRAQLMELQRLPGEVTHWLGESAPEGWAFLDGRGLSAAEFPALFDVLGYRYGGADGIFRLPLRAGVGDCIQPMICLR